MPGMYRVPTVLAVVGLATVGCFDGFPAGPGAAAEAGAGPADVGPGVDDPNDSAPTDGLADSHDVSPDVHPDRAMPAAETCNGVDDDGDGQIDEGFAIGEPCFVGAGECRRDGRTQCAPDGQGAECDAVAGMPQAELCNGLDDDCSGVIDENFDDLDAPCTAGSGVCETSGRTVCAGDGAGTACDARADDLRRTLETCNDIDDDCDGSVDEGLVRSCSTGETGICDAGRSVCNEGSWSLCLPEVPVGSRQDICNGVDDDCDGRPDQNDLPVGPVPCQDCADGVAADGCMPSTPCLRQCLSDAPGEVVCAPAPEADCDGRDDDCDGAIDDDRVCGAPLVDTCAFGLGWTRVAIQAPSQEWGACDIDAGGFDDTFSCNRTRPGIFADIGLPDGADVDAVDDRLGVNLRCSLGAVGDYIVAHCRVILGLATAAAGVADGAEAWGPCPGDRVGGDDAVACTSSRVDGGFDPLSVPFDLTADQLIGVAFVCQDPDDPQRAAALQSSIAVAIAWADTAAGDDVDWSATCSPLGDGEPFTACARTRGDGRFRTMRLTADVDGGDRFAIQLSPL